MKGRVVHSNAGTAGIGWRPQDLEERVSSHVDRFG